MPSADLAFALDLADLADSVSLPRFRARDLRVETKPDLTPVTDVDRAVERAVRERGAGSRRGEGVVGEEEGGEEAKLTAASSRRRRSAIAGGQPAARGRSATENRSVSPPCLGLQTPPCRRRTGATSLPSSRPPGTPARSVISGSTRSSPK